MYTFEQVASSQFTIQLYIDPVTMGICPDIKKELDEIDKKFDEARGVKSKYNLGQLTMRKAHN